MEDYINEFSYPGGEIQRIHTVRFDGWEGLDFLSPSPSPEAFDRVCSLYRDFIVPRCPWIFGKLVLFTLPDGMNVPFSFEDSRYGAFDSPLTAAAAVFRRHVRIIGGKPVIDSTPVREFFEKLEAAGCIRLALGALPFTVILPVGNSFGFLSGCEESARMKVNASFFIMDRFDCSTVYDTIGTPLGLCVKDGKVLNPPLYSREAFAADKNGKGRIFVPELSDLSMEIHGEIYKRENRRLYTRFDRQYTPPGKVKDIVIIGNRAAAVHAGGLTPVPSSGFVLRAEPDSGIVPGDEVIYRGYEDIAFGIQVGNSIIRDGEKTEKFISPFFNIKHPWTVSFPPSLYPLDFERARAPRIALGEDAQGRSMISWMEGMGKFGYEPGKESRGASLGEMAELCKKLGYVNAVNLDGGGSAQLLINNARSLLVSDRKKSDFSEVERAIPMGLIIR